VSGEQATTCKAGCDCAIDRALRGGSALFTEVRLVGGPFGGQGVALKRTPPRIAPAGYTYYRIDDPDTGEFLGGYVAHAREAGGEQ